MKILFVYQDDLCTRAGLIPAQEFLSVRGADWELIKDSAELFSSVPVLWDSRTGSQEWSELISTICQALEWGEEAVAEKDRSWACKVQPLDTRPLDPIFTYKQLAAQHKDQLMGGIAKLKTDQGQKPFFSNTNEANK